ncbi:MAG: hypothetical protein ACYDAK_12955 [Candidatus Limnocylindrales bacterium]
MSKSGLLCNVCYYTDNDVIYTRASFEIDGQLLCPKHFKLLGDDTPVTYRTQFEVLTPSTKMLDGLASAVRIGIRRNMHAAVHPTEVRAHGWNDGLQRAIEVVDEVLSGIVIVSWDGSTVIRDEVETLI